ncbi:MAG: Na(+)/H(+) antiporter subunit D [Candidatus Aminicenantes bacterium]|nr:Na(+)/H(+) antiporter subunit D [Candidatus Aminicenantes bacterium]
MLNEWVLPPAFFMIAGAFLLPFLTKKVRPFAFLFVTFITLFYILSIPEGANFKVQLMDYNLTLFKVDSLSRIFGIIFAFIAFAGGIYSFHIKETGQQVAALFYAGSAIGVTFAGDFFSLFIYWEIMAVASTYLIWARGTRESQKAGMRYLLYHVLGGGILFAGILLHISKPGANLLITGKLSPESLSSWLILLGVVINAAVPPLHAWLSDAYPKATVTGAVFLSAFTTKTAVYVLLRLFPGWEILLIFGTIMTVYGVIFAILSNDIRGILAYHIISQVGYMVAGVGIGTYMSLDGSAAHAFSHILYKALLFMGAGMVLHTTGRSKLTQLGGLYHAMPRTFWLYMVAAFSISGFPLFNGFISKSMVVAGALEAHHGIAYLFLNLAAVGTFLSVGIKLPYFTWFSKQKDKNPVVEKPPKNMHIGMALVAFFCILHGIVPSLLYRYLPTYLEHQWNPFTSHHLVEAVQLLTFTFIAFWIFRKKLQPQATISLDTDWFYRRPARLARKIFVDSVSNTFDRVENMAFVAVDKLVAFGKNPFILIEKSKDKTYTPDRYRPAIQLLILAILGIFIFLTLLSLF